MMRASLHHSGISRRFLGLLVEEGLAARRVLDVGCGSGRLSLVLARWALRVIGLDRDTRAIADARARAAATGLSNVEFHEADVEREEYRRWVQAVGLSGVDADLITAHLCAADAIVERAGRALAVGAALGIVAFHVDQWRETGRVSRFAYDEARMDALLRRTGFTPEALEVEREVSEFGSVEEGLAAAVALEDRWKADGRWYGYLAFLEAGGRTLTRSYLIVKARRS